MQIEDTVKYAGDLGTVSGDPSYEQFIAFSTRLKENGEWAAPDYGRLLVEKEYGYSFRVTLRLGEEFHVLGYMPPVIDFATGRRAPYRKGMLEILGWHYRPHTLERIDPGTCIPFSTFRLSLAPAPEAHQAVTIAHFIRIPNPHG